MQILQYTLTARNLGSWFWTWMLKTALLRLKPRTAGMPLQTFSLVAYVDPLLRSTLRAEGCTFITDLHPMTLNYLLQRAGLGPGWIYDRRGDTCLRPGLLSKGSTIWFRPTAHIPPQLRNSLYVAAHPSIDRKTPTVLLQVFETGMRPTTLTERDTGFGARSQPEG